MENAARDRLSRVGLEQLGRDVAHGWRRLRATPFFTTFAVLTLAAGIGVTTAIHSVVRAVLAPPSGVRDAGMIVYLFHTPCCSGPIHSLSWPDSAALTTSAARGPSGRCPT